MLEKVYHNIIDTFSISEIVWFENDGSLLVCDAHCIEIDIYSCCSMDQMVAKLATPVNHNLENKFEF